MAVNPPGGCGGSALAKLLKTMAAEVGENSGSDPAKPLKKDGRLAEVECIDTTYLREPPPYGAATLFIEHHYERVASGGIGAAVDVGPAVKQIAPSGYVRRQSLTEPLRWSPWWNPSRTIGRYRLLVSDQRRPSFGCRKANVGGAFKTAVAYDQR